MEIQPLTDEEMARYRLWFGVRHDETRFDNLILDAYYRAKTLDQPVAMEMAKKVRDTFVR